MQTRVPILPIALAFAVGIVCLPARAQILDDFDDWTDMGYVVNDGDQSPWGGLDAAGGLETSDLSPGTDGTQAMAISYTHTTGGRWGEWYWEPARRPFDLSSATDVTFWAKGSSASGQRIDLEFFTDWDNASESVEFALTDSWQIFTFALNNVTTLSWVTGPVNLADIRFLRIGLSTTNTGAETIWVDEIMATTSGVVTVLDTEPPRNGWTETLTEVSVTFSQTVAGVDASDLSVASSEATSVVSGDDRTFTFSGYASPPDGTVDVTLAAGGITGAATGDAFEGDAWQCFVGAAASNAAERIMARDFPSIHQAWNAADNLPGEDADVTLARHDLIWHGPGYFGMQWDHASHQGLATDFTGGSAAAGMARRNRILALNPNMIFLCEIRYRDAHDSFLPEDSDWWMRDGDGNRVPGWVEGGYFILNYPDPTYQDHVATRCKAAMDSGVFDGVMLDWWVDDADRLSLVQRIRDRIGYDALILANSNDRRIPNTAPYVNGLFMECYDTSTEAKWRQIETTLAWAEANLLPPRINCLETWFETSRQDLNRMRATTAMSLTYGDGYCLFADPNELPGPDHLHDWYPFWDREIRAGAPKLGKPVAAGVRQADGTVTREFEHGTVVYNPVGNADAMVEFPSPMESVATGNVATTHTVPGFDGDIFVGPIGGDSDAATWGLY